MCTVTYLPTSNNQYILTSNRDEQAARSPKNISRVNENGIELLFPRDSAAGGSWIAISNTNKTVCLLNGAFEKHKRQLPYRISRGIMVLDFFKYKNAISFFGLYNFDNIEPFTMIIVDEGQPYEFRWDGQKHIKKLDVRKPYIWSSSTLYPKEMRIKREGWFHQWLDTKPEFNRTTITDLHQNGGEGDPYNDFVMNRKNIVQTVSITSIVKQADSLNMHYIDLVNEQRKEECIQF